MKETTDIRECCAWARSITRLSIAMHAMDGVPFLGIGPEFREECKEIWDRMDYLKHKMELRLEELEKEMAVQEDKDARQMLFDNLERMQEGCD